MKRYPVAGSCFHMNQALILKTLDVNSSYYKVDYYLEEDFCKKYLGRVGIPEDGSSESYSFRLIKL